MWWMGEEGWGSRDEVWGRRGEGGRVRDSGEKGWGIREDRWGRRVKGDPISLLRYVQTRWDFCDIFISSKDIRNFRFSNYLTVHDCLISNFLKITVLNVEILLNPNLLECVEYFLPLTSYCRNQLHFLTVCITVQGFFGLKTDFFVLKKICKSFLFVFPAESWDSKLSCFISFVNIGTIITVQQQVSEKNVRKPTHRSERVNGQMI